MENLADIGSWLLGRFGAYAFGSVKQNNELIANEITDLQYLFELLKENYLLENLFHPIFLDSEISFFQDMYKPKDYGVADCNYLGCSRELIRQYREIHDKVTLFLHNES